MRTIDIHAHVSPEGFVQAFRNGGTWHGMMANSVPNMLYNPRTTWTPEERIADMNSLGVDVQVLSTNAFFYSYDKEASATTAMARECNDYVAQLVKDHPARFSGFATLPMQDVTSAVSELEHAMNIGLKGAMIGDHVNGKTFDEPEFMPLWKSAEASGAVFLIHQGGDTVVTPRSSRYHLPNTIGNLADRAVTFASFVFGGVDGRLPRSARVPVPRRRLYLLRHRPHGPGLAGAPRSTGAYHPTAQQIPGQVLLRLPDPQRGGPALSD